jgi:hypothetical protein
VPGGRWAGAEVGGLLRAGGLVPPGAAGAADPPADTVRARRYGHEALGGRPVVRLVADAVAGGEDLALAHLGFDRLGAGPPLAAARAQTLGFPGWALANDPASATRALAVAAEMERLGHLARGRPGAAREAFEALGADLARSLPHLLPAFYEQAARTFLEVDNPAQAAVLFGRAREAERAYGLPLDEERRRRVFVEFALAGALATRDLDGYAQQLSATVPPDRAYAEFRDLCVRRARGGEPPWTGMARQLRRLAAAAGLDAGAEDQAVVAELLEAPATARAVAGFWRAYRAAIVALARESPAVRGRLLGLLPSPPRESDELLAWWVGLLDASGALESLVRPAGAFQPEAEAEDGPAGWLGRLLAGRPPGPAGLRALAALLPRLAPRLRADGRPVRLLGTRWADELDLLDLALELRLPLVPPSPGQRLELHRWAEAAGRPRRPLRHVAADPAFGPLLLAAVDRWLMSQQADQLLAGPGPAWLLGHWLGHVAGRMEATGLVRLDEEVGRLERSVPARALAANPEAARRILGCDVAAALARTIRGGLLDELGWPALEEAREELSPGRWPGIRLSQAWPNLVVADGSRAIVVGPAGRLLTHDVRLPAALRQRLQGCLYAGGQVLVCWWDGGHRAYWSGSPSEVFDPGRSPEREWTVGRIGASVELPDGGRTIGGRAVHAGDVGLPEEHHVLSDGVRCWRVAQGQAHEYDPVTGQEGERSLPAFLAEFAAPGRELVLARCWLLPLPPELAGNPLGDAGGLAGWRLRRAPGGFEGEGVDGRTFAGGVRAPAGTALEAPHADAPVAMVAMPGDEDRPRALTYAARSVSLWSPDRRVELLRERVGEHRPALARGTPLVPPPLFWACLRPRDPAGSAVLRRLDDADARRVLAAAVRDLERNLPELPAAAAAVRALLPAVRHEGLAAGVVGAAGRAAEVARRLDALRPAVQRQPAAPAAGDHHLVAALGGLERRGAMPWEGVAGLPGPAGAFGQVREVGTYFDLALGGADHARDIMPVSFPSTTVRWTDLVGRMAGVALRAASPATPAPVREPLLALLELWATTPFAVHPEWFQVVRAVELDPADRKPTAWLRWSGGRHYFLSPRETAGGAARRTVIEGSASGTFTLLKGFEAESERATAGSWERPDRLRRLVALARELGPFTWRPEAAPALAARTGLTRAESALLLAGLPNAGSTHQDFLGRPTRELLDLKVTEAAAARDALERVAPEDRLALLAAATPDEPERLWEAGPDVERLAAAATRLLGRRPAVADELVVRARAELGPAAGAGDALLAAADPDASEALRRDVTWEIRPGGQLATRRPAEGQLLDGGLLLAVASLVPWLFVTLPVGDPVRERLPRLLRRVRERLASPDLLVGGDWMPAERQGRSVLDLVPGGPHRGPGGQPLAGSREAGPLIVLVTRHGLARAYVRPAAVGGEQDGGLARMFPPAAALHAAAGFLLGPGASAFAERVVRTPVPRGGYEAGAAASAPELVAEVAASLGLSGDGAALYLEVLAMAEPTVRSLLTWNGWTHDRLEGAVAECVERGLLVEGRRPRAARGFFLPGAWAVRRPPDRPLEAWKLPLHEDAPLGRVLPLRPPHELFAEAWRRVRRGDGPRFEEGGP